MDDILLSRAFEVEEIPDDFDPNKVPTTAQEYMQLVKYEALKYPDVVVADLDRKKIRNHVDINKLVGLNDSKLFGKSDLAPPIEWQQAQIAIFSRVRKNVELCAKSKKIVQTIMSLPKTDREDHLRKTFGGVNNPDYKEPTLSTLLSMGENLRIELLEYHGKWLDDGIAPHQGKWIYALLACLSIPLMPDTCSILRVLASKCAQIRNTKTSQNDGTLVPLNLIICLVSKYFGQADLGD